MLWLSSFAIAVPGDFDADGCVATADLQTFAASWLTNAGGDLDSDADTDLADFAIFAGYWLDGCVGNGVPPTASNGTSSPVTHIWQTITLTATDDGNPNPPAKLKYVITSLPTVGVIYDPKSGSGKIDHVPYTLSSWGNAVSYWTATAGADTLQFKADDGGVSPMGGQSSAATVTITATANPKDCLSFDGQGLVSIPDGTYLDAVSGWAIDFWIKTRQPYSTLVKKRATGTGYEIKLVGGKPVIQFFDTNGQELVLLQYPYRVDNGAWHEVGVTASNYSSGWLVKFHIDQDDLTSQAQLSGAMPSFDNSESVMIGAGHKNQFDKLRFYSGLTHPGDLSDIIQLFGNRTESGDEQVFGIGAISSVLFMCNEATGTTITDSKTSKVGTFNSADHVSWLPYFDPFADVSVQQNYRGAK